MVAPVTIAHAGANSRGTIVEILSVLIRRFLMVTVVLSLCLTVSDVVCWEKVSNAMQPICHLSRPFPPHLTWMPLKESLRKIKPFLASCLKAASYVWIMATPFLIGSRWMYEAHTMQTLTHYCQGPPSQGLHVLQHAMKDGQQKQGSVLVVIEMHFCRSRLNIKSKLKSQLQVCSPYMLGNSVKNW